MLFFYVKHSLTKEIIVLICTTAFIYHPRRHKYTHSHNFVCVFQVPKKTRGNRQERNIAKIKDNKTDKAV